MQPYLKFMTPDEVRRKLFKWILQENLRTVNQSQ
jgi:hypothetical protein